MGNPWSALAGRNRLPDVNQSAVFLIERVCWGAGNGWIVDSVDVGTVEQLCHNNMQQYWRGLGSLLSHFIYHLRASKIYDCVYGAASVFSAREQSLLSHVDFVSHQNASRTLTVEVLQAFPTGASRSRPQASWRDYRSLLASACAIRSSRVSLGKTPFGLPCIACLCCDQDQIKGLKWLDRCMNRFIIECNHLKTFSHGMDAFE